MTLPWRILLLLTAGVATCALLGGVVLTFTLDNEQVHRLAEAEQRDIRAAREADLRLCARGNLTRAEIHLQLGRVDRSILPGVRERQPLLDCSPNLSGTGAVRLVPMEQRRFVEFYARHQGAHPRIRNGRVVMALPPIVVEGAPVEAPHPTDQP